MRVPRFTPGMYQIYLSRMSFDGISWQFHSTERPSSKNRFGIKIMNRKRQLLVKEKIELYYLNMIIHQMKKQKLQHQQQLVDNQMIKIFKW